MYEASCLRTHVRRNVPQNHHDARQQDRSVMFPQRLSIRLQIYYSAEYTASNKTRLTASTAVLYSLGRGGGQQYRSIAERAVKTGHGPLCCKSLPRIIGYSRKKQHPSLLVQNKNGRGHPGLRLRQPPLTTTTTAGVGAVTPPQKGGEKQPVSSERVYYRASRLDCRHTTHLEQHFQLDGSLLAGARQLLQHSLRLRSRPLPLHQLADELLVRVLQAREHRVRRLGETEWGGEGRGGGEVGRCLFVVTWDTIPICVSPSGVTGVGM